MLTLLLCRGRRKSSGEDWYESSYGETIADLGGAFPQCLHSSMQKNLESWSFSDKITPVLAPHASDTVSDEQALKISSYAKSNNIPIHMHLSQTSGEYSRTTKRTNMSPVAWAKKMELLSENTLAVHLITATEDDVKILKDSGASGVICPASQIIYEKVANISKLKASGLPLCIATDCAASNDSANILSELKLAALLDKHLGTAKIDHSYWFSSVTERPAKALGMESLIGTLAPGKKADLVFHQKNLANLPINPWVNLI